MHIFVWYLSLHKTKNHIAQKSVLSVLPAKVKSTTHIDNVKRYGKLNYKNQSVLRLVN